MISPVGYIIEERDLGAAIRQGGKHIKHFQAIANDRGTPGSGSIDGDGVYSALAEINYDGWSAIETFANLPSRGLKMLYGSVLPTYFTTRYR